MVILYYYVIVSELLLLLLVVIHCMTSNSSILNNLIIAQKQFIAFTWVYCFSQKSVFSKNNRCSTEVLWISKIVHFFEKKWIFAESRFHLLRMSNDASATPSMLNRASKGRRKRMPWLRRRHGYWTSKVPCRFSSSTLKNKSRIEDLFFFKKTNPGRIFCFFELGATRQKSSISPAQYIVYIRWIADAWRQKNSL